MRMNYTKGHRHFILSCDIHIVDFDTPSHNLDKEVGLEMGTWGTSVCCLIVPAVIRSDNVDGKDWLENRSQSCSENLLPWVKAG